jgi:DNA polymerase sigma
MSTSDLDLSLNVSAGFNPATREQKIQILKKLLKVLRRLEDCKLIIIDSMGMDPGNASGCITILLCVSGGVVQEIQPIFRAKVPVVKFLHCNTGIECDISVENRDGIIKSELLRNFAHIDPRFRKLCFLVCNFILKCI